MRPSRSLSLALALGLAAALAGPARVSAGPPTEQLRGHIDRVLRVLEDPALRGPERALERRAAVRRIANEIFDFPETARRSLGPHWQARTPDERREFVGLFGDLLERSYISRIELYGGERIQYVGDNVDGDQARVQSKLLTRAGSEIPIEYRMLRRGDQWRVYDVVIEGVSLIASYRTQFNRIIRSSSFEELVRKMKSRQEELGA
jgi:phospholipid transport system substrate-binding protein